METIISISMEAVICIVAIILGYKVYTGLSHIIKTIYDDMRIKAYNKRQDVTILSDDEFESHMKDFPKVIKI